MTVEDELKLHFKDVARNYAIAEFSMAYDNEIEIDLCSERG